MIGCGSQRHEADSRLREAVDAASPEDITQVHPRPVYGQGRSLSDVLIYRYDYGEVDRLEKRYRGVPRAAFLREEFTRAIKGHENGSDNEKWLAVMNYLSRTLRHPAIEQPMYPDRTMVTDPMILLLLREGRCGHQARVVVDMALANHYEARLVQLAAHLVAEVKWGGEWHWIDADAGIPADSLRSRFAELPSVEALARNPYVLDGFAARNWEMGESAHRTFDGMYVPQDCYYPGSLLPSSTYFGEQIFTGVFGGRTALKKPAITYYYKEGAIAKWETDRYWGWNGLRAETRSIPTVPVDYAPLRLTITGPAAVFAEGGRAVIPVRWVAQGRPVCEPRQVRNCRLIFDKLAYEVRVSRATRGWDYDFRDYDFMPGSGKGDVLVTRKVRKVDATTFGIDVPVHDISGVFIEVAPVALDKAHGSEFMWPSNELAVQVEPCVADLSKPAGRTTR
jgi:hypothetical protein